MIQFKDITGKNHILLPCEVGDIDPHFEKIKGTVTRDTSEKVFRERMASCISSGSAYKDATDSCFLYYRNKTHRQAEGVAMFSGNSPLKMLALFAGVFTELDTQTVRIDFHLHKGKLLQEYKSILTLTSIKRQLVAGYPLVVRVDEMKAKLTTLYKERGIL